MYASGEMKPDQKYTLSTLDLKRDYQFLESGSIKNLDLNKVLGFSVSHTFLGVRGD